MMYQQASRMWTHGSQPVGDGGCEADGGQEVMRLFVEARRDSAPSIRGLNARSMTLRCL